MVRVNMLLARAGISNVDGDGAVIIVPSLDSACRCDYRCVALDEHRHETKCLCPDGWYLGNDTTSCLPLEGPVLHIPTEYWVLALIIVVAFILCTSALCMHFCE
jgi:hypothetical protein